MVNLDRELVDRVRKLKLEFREVPQPELLIRIPNRNPGVDYWVECVTGEFTSLCPLNMGQPDYATICIRYRPGDWCVELKSLKFFLVSFRTVAVFHEEVPATILKALSELLEPEELEVIGFFTTRGGIKTTVRATYYKKGV